MKTIIKNALLVNEGKIFPTDVLIWGERIEKIASDISATNATIIDAHGSFLLPGVIDDQVHFREPGLTHKANIATESVAAVAGGVTSFFEQPNTQPQTTTLSLLEQKYQIAQKHSLANFSFFLGGTNENLEELKSLDTTQNVGVKLFLGSSTGNMLVDNPQTLREIFGNVNAIIAAHCEDEKTIQQNLKAFEKRYNGQIPIACHPQIRSAEACYLSSSQAVDLAQKTGARLHIFHVSTAKELSLFRNDIPLENKQITTEVCVHHLYFSQEDYTEKGALIKWNPAVKTHADRQALWEGLLQNRLDVIATDHAPHTWQEKQQGNYSATPSGAPMVQHALPLMLKAHSEGKISLEKLVEKMCHNPAILFRMVERGFVREGYFADLVLVKKNPWRVGKENILYKCGWSPLQGTELTHSVTDTFVNGHRVFSNGKFFPKIGKRITFNPDK